MTPSPVGEGRATDKTVCREWHGRWKGLPDVVVNVSATTAGKARAEVLRKARDAGFDARLTEIQVRRGQWITCFSVWL